MPTPTTPNRGYQLPDPANQLAQDVYRIVAGLTAIDADVQTILTAALTIAGQKTFSDSPLAPTPTVGDNSTKLATTAFVVAAINAIVNAAPGALDTLAELATALGNDPNFATTVTTTLAGKAPLVHVHAQSDVTGLVTALAAKLDSTAQTGVTTITALTTAGSATWTCPAGVTRAKITVIGGGGSGGVSGTSGAGGGGGAGGTAIKVFTNLVPGTAYNYTVGAAGGTSSFTGPGSVVVQATGGSNGASANAAAGGAGGVGSGGDLNITGEGGSSGIYGASGAISGQGGSTLFGGGSRGLSIISGQVAGVSAAGFGAGGSGGAAVVGTNQAGGAGAAGAIIIEY